MLPVYLCFPDVEGSAELWDGAACNELPTKDSGGSPYTPKQERTCTFSKEPITNLLSEPLQKYLTSIDVQEYEAEILKQRPPTSLAKSSLAEFLNEDMVAPLRGVKLVDTLSAYLSREVLEDQDLLHMVRLADLIATVVHEAAHVVAAHAVTIEGEMDVIGVEFMAQGARATTVFAPCPSLSFAQFICYLAAPLDFTPEWALPLQPTGPRTLHEEAQGNPWLLIGSTGTESDQESIKQALAALQLFGRPAEELYGELNLTLDRWRDQIGPLSAGVVAVSRFMADRVTKGVFVVRGADLLPVLQAAVPRGLFRDVVRTTTPCHPFYNTDLPLQ